MHMSHALSFLPSQSLPVDIGRLAIDISTPTYANLAAMLYPRGQQSSLQAAIRNSSTVCIRIYIPLYGVYDASKPAPINDPRY